MEMTYQELLDLLQPENWWTARNVAKDISALGLLHKKGGELIKVKSYVHTHIGLVFALEKKVNNSGGNVALYASHFYRKESLEIAEKEGTLAHITTIHLERKRKIASLLAEL